MQKILCSEKLVYFFCCMMFVENIFLLVVQDLDHLEVIWELVAEWQSSWDSWKSNTFATLETDSMSLQAQGMLKRLNKEAREVKVCTSLIKQPGLTTFLYSQGLLHFYVHMIFF